MVIKVIKTGDEPGIAGAVAWLERHGIPKTTIRGVTITGDVGEPLMITPTIIIEDPAELGEAPYCPKCTGQHDEADHDDEG